MHAVASQFDDVAWRCTVVAVAVTSVTSQFYCVAVRIRFRFVSPLCTRSE